MAVVDPTKLNITPQTTSLIDPIELDSLSDLRTRVTNLQSWLTVILRGVDADSQNASVQRAMTEAREYFERLFPDDPLNEKRD